MGIKHKAAVLLEHGHVAAMVEAAKKSTRVVATKDEVSKAIENFGEFLSRNRHQDAVALLLALMLWDADQTIARVRRAGLFRASRYDFRTKGVRQTVKAALEFATEIAIQPHRLSYLRSVLILMTAADEARHANGALLERLKARRLTAQKSQLVLVNAAFSSEWIGDPSADSNCLRHWGSEDLSMALSYVLHLMRKEIGREPKLWQHVDEQLCQQAGNVYADLLIEAARINEFLEAEQLLDVMPYRVVENGNVLQVCSTDEMLEKSIRLGYIQSNTQRAIQVREVLHQYEIEGQTPRTMASFVAEAFQAGMGELVILENDPITRLVFLTIQDPGFFAPLAADFLFVEDAVTLASTGIENYQQDSEGPLRVSDTLLVMDLIKVQRYFSFIHAVFDEKLREIEDDQLRKKLRIRSTLPIMPAAILRQQLEFILPPDKVDEALKLLTLAEDEKFIDLQYKPLIAAGEYFVVAPALISRSNLARNTVVANKLRKASLGHEDPMEKMVIRALLDAGFKVRNNFDFKIGTKRETDIVCWRDGHLFLLECKNAYHPCCARETMNSFELLRTAEEQLDHRLEWLGVAENQQSLIDWLGWNVPRTTEIHTGVVVANRVFNGYSIGLHPVRQAHELINVVKRGEVKTGDGETRSFWRGQQFHALDLVDYLRGGSIINEQFSKLDPFDRNVRIGKIILSRRNYLINHAER